MKFKYCNPVIHEKLIIVLSILLIAMPVKSEEYCDLGEKNVETTCLKYLQSEQLEVTTNALPFKTYTEWFEDLKSQYKHYRPLERFVSSTDPYYTNLMLPKIAAYWMEYESDGMNISGAIVVPRQFNLKRQLPVLIYNRGGNAKTPLTRGSILRYLAPIAAEGYLVLASNYRGSKFSEGEDQFGGEDVNDVLNLVNIVSSIPMADDSKIAMMGESRGGMMTYQALRREHDRIDTAIVIGGVSDLMASLEHRPEMEDAIFKHYIPGYSENKEIELQKRSAYYWADQMSPKTPILMLHGALDLRVDVNQSIKLSNKLKSLNRDNDLRVFEFGDHNLRFYHKEVLSEIIRWLDNMN